MSEKSLIRILASAIHHSHEDLQIIEEVVTTVCHDLKLCKEALDIGFTPTNLECILEVIPLRDDDLIAFHMNHYLDENVFTNPNWCDVFDAMCSDLSDNNVIEYFFSLWTQRGQTPDNTDWDGYTLSDEYIIYSLVEMVDKDAGREDEEYDDEDDGEYEDNGERNDPNL